MRPPTFTILGASGFVGRNLVKYLKSAGLQCKAPHRDSIKTARNYAGHLIYAIGLTSDFRTHPLETVEAHVCLLHKILAEAEFDSLTYLSSTRLYQGVEGTAENSSLKINPHALDSIYNISKAMGESLCLHSGRKNVKIARVSNIVGLRDDADIFIEQVLHDVVAKGRVHIQDSLLHAKDYVSIDDAVSAIVKIALSEADGCFNIASGENTSHRKLLRHLKSHFEFELEGGGGDLEQSLAPICIDRARAILGFEPKPFDKFFPKYLDQYKRMRGLA